MKGSPEINVTWYKNNMLLNSSEKYKISFSDSAAVLEINDINVEDSGDYVCEAQNEAGTDSCSTIITVKGSYNVAAVEKFILFISLTFLNR